ncbi:hypothetical protein [uncultured Luteimonas sp.]|uniref:hypothetical protein n=1 Tax=uncultured Luteimonas sp. TaxID=453144 RepID=UPI00262C9515|nr:hypothetical protein [uncultured Luteimonas sp.]
MDDASLLTGGLGLVVVLFLFVLALLWFLLPFAVFGIKDLLKELIRETRATREVLQATRTEATAARELRPVGPPPPGGTARRVGERVEPTFGEILDRDRTS